MTVTHSTTSKRFLAAFGAAAATAVALALLFAESVERAGAVPAHRRARRSHLWPERFGRLTAAPYSQ